MKTLINNLKQSGSKADFQALIGKLSNQGVSISTDEDITMTAYPFEYNGVKYVPFIFVSPELGPNYDIDKLSDFFDFEYFQVIDLNTLNYELVK